MRTNPRADAAAVCLSDLNITALAKHAHLECAAALRHAQRERKLIAAAGIGAVDPAVVDVQRCIRICPVNQHGTAVLDCAGKRHGVVAIGLIDLVELLASAEKSSRNYVEIALGNRSNRFYLFGGKDESSAALIQGITLGGVFLDEVALMPRTFVEQALARCSLHAAKMWFNCNPDHPYHWFYREWILKAEQKNALYLHFTMDDNPSLTPAIKRRYESLYSGAFYDRFVLGKWVAAQGLVYPFFSRSVHVAEPEGIPSRYFISCDYGTVNPSSFGLWGEYGGRWYRLSEYYFDSRREGEQRTDEEHYAALEQLAGDLTLCFFFSHK